DEVQVERAVEIDADHLVPEGAVGVEKRQRYVPTGDVGQQFHGPRVVLEHVGRSRDRIAVGDVDLVDEHAPTLAGAQPRGFLGACKIQVEDTDVATLLDKAHDRRPADPASAAG